METDLVLGDDEPVAGDSSWQRTARRRQSQWRLMQGLQAGLHNGRLLGSRLTPEDGAPPQLAGYVTAAAKRQVQLAVRDAIQTGALLSRPRLWVDLLSSQPLCFNAFADMAEDLTLATRVFTWLMPEVISSVTAIRFEYSPGRGDPRYTGSRSAFDVFLEAAGPKGRGFVGVEVKYHESMRVSPAVDRGYANMARATGVFREEAIARLLRPPLQQLLLDHLLALRLQAAEIDRWNWGVFVLLAPNENAACNEVASTYASALTDTGTFLQISLELLFDALEQAAHKPWVADLRRRYLGPDAERA